MRSFWSLSIFLTELLIDNILKPKFSYLISKLFINGRYNPPHQPIAGPPVKRKADLLHPEANELCLKILQHR
jgi:hypothetical protein